MFYNDSTNRFKYDGLRYLPEIARVVILITIDKENHPVTPLVIVVEFANNSLM